MKLVYFFTFLFLSSCAITPDSQKTQLTFMDTNTFDHELSNSMAAHPQMITVSMLGKVSINKIPKRLGKWLGAVTEKKGRLDVNPSNTKSLALIIAVLSGLPSIYKWVKIKVSYANTIHHNAKIFYTPETGNIQKVIFRKKEKPIVDSKKNTVNK